MPYRRPLALLAVWLALGLAVLAAEIALDASGNLLLNSDPNRTVTVNGFDFGAWGNLLAERDRNISALTRALQEKEGERHALRGALSALQRIPIGPFNQIYVLGGNFVELSQDGQSVESYGGDSWNPAVSLPVPLMWHRAVVLSQNIYVMGGVVGPISQTTTERIVYKFNGVAWTPLESMLESRDSFAAVVYEKGIYVLGGYYFGNVLSDTEVYRENEGWIGSKSMRTARWCFDAVAFRGRIYAMGGFLDKTKASASKSTEFFVSGAWYTDSDMPVSRAYHGAAVLGDSIYVAGGTEWTEPLQSVDRFDGTTWTSVPSMQVSRVGFALVAFRGALFAVGGLTTKSLIASASVETFNGTAWVNSKTMASSRSEFAAVVLAL